MLATIPVGVIGLVGEHWFRTTLAKPTPTAIFLMLNGVVLIAAERLRCRGRALDSEYVDERETGPESDERLAAQPVGRSVLIGSAQILALAPDQCCRGSARICPSDS